MWPFSHRIVELPRDFTFEPVNEKPRLLWTAEVITTSGSHVIEYDNCVGPWIGGYDPSALYRSFERDGVPVLTVHGAHLIAIRTISSVALPVEGAAA